MMKTLKIGIVGAGFAGQQHIEAIRRIPGTEVVALAERDPAAADALCERMNISGCFFDYRTMLESADLDVVHNCTPNAEHFAINRDVILSGRHIFSEKPLAINSAQSAELTTLCARHHVANAVNFNYRQNAMVQVMRQRLQSGEPGRVLMVHGHYLQDWLLYETDFNWRMDPEIGGPSRAVGDIGSHWFDLVQFITGQRISEVYARLITVHPVRKRPDGRSETFGQLAGGLTVDVSVSTEDAGILMLRLLDGTMCSLTVSQVCAGHKNDLQICVSASQYAMEWAQENPDKLNIGHRGKANELLYSSPEALTGTARRYAPLPGGHPVAWADSVRNGMSEFFTSIREGTFDRPEQTYATFQDAHEVMRAVDACLVSNRENRWVSVL